MNGGFVIIKYKIEFIGGVFMKKGERTRENIIIKSAEIFNQKGYAGTSLNDIIESTGIKKGGIYRHFSDKNDIAIEAYKYASGTVRNKFDEAIAIEQSATKKLLSMFTVYADVVYNPPFIGGCPVQNTAIESYDTHPELFDNAREGMHSFLDLLTEIILEGIQSGEFKENTNADYLASFTFSLLEGSILLSKIDHDNKHVKRNQQMLLDYLKYTYAR